MAQGPINYEGLAILIGALTAAASVVGGFVMLLLAFIRQGHVTMAMVELGHSVNGQTKELKETIARSNRAEGKADGIASERLKHSTIDAQAPEKT